LSSAIGPTAARRMRGAWHVRQPGWEEQWPFATSLMFRLDAAFGIAIWAAVFGTPVASRLFDSYDRSFALMASCSRPAAITQLTLSTLLRSRRQRLRDATSTGSQPANGLSDKAEHRSNPTRRGRRRRSRRQPRSDAPRATAHTGTRGTTPPRQVARERRYTAAAPLAAYCRTHDRRPFALGVCRCHTPGDSGRRS
jgi:hypothetical protein